MGSAQPFTSRLLIRYSSTCLRRAARRAFRPFGRDIGNLALLATHLAIGYALYYQVQGPEGVMDELVVFASFTFGPAVITALALFTASLLTEPARMHAELEAEVRAMRVAASAPDVEIVPSQRIDLKKGPLAELLTLGIKNTGNRFDEFEVLVAGWYIGKRNTLVRADHPLEWEGEAGRSLGLSPGATGHVEFAVIEKDFSPAEGAPRHPERGVPTVCMIFRAPWYYGGARWPHRFWDHDTFEPTNLHVEVIVASRQSSRARAQDVCVHFYGRPEDDPMRSTFHMSGGPAIRFMLCAAPEGVEKRGEGYV